MKLDRIRIENFRSYEDSGEIDLTDKTVLIGENNAGKSNVLRALKLFLDLSPTTPHSIEDSHLREGDDIEIEAWFTDLDDEAAEAFEEYIIDGELFVRTVYPFGKQGDPKSKQFEVRAEVPRNSDFRVNEMDADDLKEVYERHEKVLEPYQPEDWGGKHGKYIEPTIERYVQEGDPEMGVERRTDPKGIKKQFKQHLPEFRFFQSDRNINDETKTTTNAVLGQLLDHALEDVPNEDREKIEESLEEISEKLNDEEKFDEIEELEDQLREKLDQQIPLDDLTINIQVPELQDILEEVSVTIDDGIETDIRTMGSGLHTAFILSSLWELSERDTGSSNVIFGLEEPENDLHPHAQRQLYDTLDDLVDQGYQVALSTHSAHLVSGDDMLDIRRVEKRGTGSRIHSVQEFDFTERQVEKIQRRMTAENNELFFSNALLLCEGETEEWILPVFNTMLDNQRDELYAFDRLGITMISTDGKSGMKPFLRLANCYNLSSVALIDNDEDRDDGHDGSREDVFELADEVRELPDDSEAELLGEATLEDFCEVMTRIVADFDTTAEDLEQRCEGSGDTEYEVMADIFGEESPSKPLFGKLMAERMSEEQLSEEFVEIMEMARRVAVGPRAEAHSEFSSGEAPSLSHD